VKRLGWGSNAFDGILALGTVLSAGYLTLRTPIPGLVDWLPTGVAAAAVWVVVLAAVLLLLGLARRLQRAGRSSLGHAGPRLVAAGVVLVLAGMAASRWSLARWDAGQVMHWPPRVADNVFGRFDQLTDNERARFAAQVAQHRLVTTRATAAIAGAAAPAATSTGTDSLISIPASWSMPDDVRIAVRRTATGADEVWARTTTGVTACVVRPDPSHKGCGDAAVAPDPTAFRAPVRVPDVISDALTSAAPSAWRQYRTSANRRGALDDAALLSPASGWRTTLGGDVRSSVSLVGDLALIGAHGNGEVAAYTARDGAVRWTSRVPNWVHMDIVSDGTIAAVGFGDNMPSFDGRAPNGVSVYDVASGELRWTRFDESSVMTSPILHDSTMVYATGMGVLRKRDARTGAILAVDTLPGGAVMAPPAFIDDTIVFGLEHRHVCAVRYSTMQRLWCHEFPTMRMMGHAAPGVQHGQAIVSGAVSLYDLSWSEFMALPWSLKRSLVRIALFPGTYEEHAGQRFMALRLSDGALLWRSPVYPKVHAVLGHIAGTAVLSDTVGVIVMPLANTVVGFHPGTGAVRWTAPAHDSRGPALLVDGVVVVAGQDGVTESRNALTGALVCQMSRKAGYDRAGPANAAGLLIFADVKGGIEAVPTTALTTPCSP
jgi:outer membrane protein assembly factor BamB